MAITVSVDVGYVDVDVDISDFDDDDLVDELEIRDYIVVHKDNQEDLFIREEIQVLLDLIDTQKPTLGSVLYFIREKIANGA